MAEATAKTASGLEISSAGDARDALLAGEFTWPATPLDEKDLDLAGLQLLIAAHRADRPIPAEILDDPALRRMTERLGLDGVGPFRHPA